MRSLLWTTTFSLKMESRNSHGNVLSGEGKTEILIRWHCSVCERQQEDPRTRGVSPQGTNTHAATAAPFTLQLSSHHLLPCPHIPAPRQRSVVNPNPHHRSFHIRSRVSYGAKLESLAFHRWVTGEAGSWWSAPAVGFSRLACTVCGDDAGPAPLEDGGFWGLLPQWVQQSLPSL